MAKSRYKLVHETYMGSSTGGWPPCRVAIYRDSEKKRYEIHSEAKWGKWSEKFYADSKTEARKVAARNVSKLRRAPECQRTARPRRGYVDPAAHYLDGKPRRF
jgi:hypothetical protein